MPSDAQLEKCLRDAVKRLIADPSVDDPTVNTVRAAAEEELELKEGFFKEGKWKAKSKDIIQNQFEKQDEDDQAEAAPPPPPPPAKAKSLKRASPSSRQTSKPRKKPKVDSSEDEGASAGFSDAPDSEEEAVSKKAKRAVPKSAAVPKPKSKRQSSDEVLSDAASIEDEPKKSSSDQKKDDDDSSELSSVIDEPPPRKRAKSSSKNSTSKPATSKPPKSKAPPTESDPNKEEIKKLQGWLAQCGIRKVWGKELKPFETSKAKISHLKKLLEEAGMTGRFSKEKAAEIKEARELAADIEAVQEGNQIWGKTSGDEDGDAEESRSKRNLIRGAQNYDFLSSDGEETD